ncbi:MAG: divergent polysaccharide deacetylase family protein [Pseudomonadales bacterium]
MRSLLAGLIIFLAANSHAEKSDNSDRQRDSLLFQQSEGMAYIAIIIDDLGHNYARGLQAAKLPASLTYAILPYSTHARRLANHIHASGKEVIVHLPMENLGNKPIGPGGLTKSLNRRDFGFAILDAVARVPHAKGINNHMGSALTQQRIPMEWLMDEIKALDFFFVDSRTTSLTIASEVARDKHLLCTSRDVFLDNNPSMYEIDKQFRRLITLAKQRGTAVAIGHPHPDTLAYLELAIPKLAAEGIEIIPASNLGALQHIYELESVSRTIAQLK